MTANVRRYALSFAGVIAVLFAVWVGSLNWSGGIRDIHQFRQTQTAMAARGLLEGGAWWSYELPLFGRPWSVPFEFPTYQGIVAVVVGATGLDLESAGRAVSLLFHVLSLVPLAMIARHPGGGPSVTAVTLILFVASPHYVFWSRTFMIESTATFFGLAYLAAFLRAKSWQHWSLVALLGIVAALTKVTTLAGFLAAAVILGASVTKGQRLRAIVFGMIAPLAAGAAWTS